MTQASALTILKMGHNVFLTGSAGAGKTYVLNEYIRYLQEHDVDVAITASTGIAATHMGGMTIHAWSGIGIRNELSDWDIESMEEKKYLWDRYDKARVLVIDEISMLSGTFLDNLDRICKAFKRNFDKPFGGLQIVLCGDLFQLPPITKTPLRPAGTSPYKGEDSATDFVVNSNAWKKSNLAMCYLTEQHRQDDIAFLNILNAIRANNVTDEHRELLETRLREFDADDFQNVTKLFTHNANVDEINAHELGNISEPEETFLMTDKGRANLIENLKKSCLAPQVLKLKLGAQVMFVKNNFDAGYVNGTRGEVVDFDSETNYPIVKTLDGDEITVEPADWSVDDDGKVLASITQIPLRHAWAITVHKSQGMSLDAAVIDLSRSFAYGMGYVALSRVRRLDGVHLVGLGENALAVDPQILSIDASLQKLSDRAESRLAELEEKDLKKSQEEFLIRSGGKLEARKLTKKELKHKGIKTANFQVSYDLIKSGKSIDAVAKDLDYTPETSINHLGRAKDSGLAIDFPHIKISNEDLEIIKQAYEAKKDEPKTEAGEIKLAPIKTYLSKNGYDFDYKMIKLAQLFLF